MKKIQDIDAFSKLVNLKALELCFIVERWKRRELDPELLFTSVEEIAKKLINASNGE